MTVWEGLATVATAWLILMGTGWVTFVAIARWKALRAMDERKRLAIERQATFNEKALGAIGEGGGPETTDAQEALREQIATIRAEKIRQRG